MLLNEIDAKTRSCPMQKNTFCQGSHCMVWRWVTAKGGQVGAPQNIQNPSLPGEGVGFCGMAPNPCEVKSS